MVVDQNTINDPNFEPEVRRKKQRSSYTSGICLILLGVLFLLKKAGLIEITWPLILIVTGIANLVATRLKQLTGGIFPGVFLLLLGLMFLTDSNYWIPGGVSSNWPLVIIVISLSLIITSIFVRDRQKHWSSGVSLLVVGGFLFFVESDWIQMGARGVIISWWPVLLIIVGIWYIFRHQSHRHTQ